jgi:hypothetical protein
LTEYTLLSEDFSGPVTKARDAYGNIITEIDNPAGWTAFWRDAQTDDPDTQILRPEMLRIDASNPNYRQPVDRLNAAGYGLKAFKQWSRIDAGWMRQVTVPAGASSLCVVLRGHCWFSQSDDASRSVDDKGDPAAGMLLWAGVDPAGGTDPYATTVQWDCDEFYDGHDDTGVYVKDPGPLATVFIRATAPWGFKHVDAYFASVEVVAWGDGPTPPAPAPDPDGYEATAMVVDYNHVTNKARRLELYSKACDLGIMVGPSFDHAATWPPGAKSYTLIVPDLPVSLHADHREYIAWRNPSIKVLFTNEATPTPPNGGGTTQPVVPPAVPPSGGTTQPAPTPPPAPKPPTYTLRSRNLIGLHAGFVRARTWDYIEQSGVTLHKFFSGGDAYEVLRRAPGCVSIWRKYVANEEGRIFEKPTIRESAQWYLDQYTAEIESLRQSWGLSLAQLLARGKVYIESLNETVPSKHPTQIQRAVEFDVRFCDAAHARYGDAVGTVLLNVAVGNPWDGDGDAGKSEVPLLLPAATVAAKHGDFLGYHAYWAANRSRDYLAEGWRWHAGRWMEWDTYFRSKGVYPRYASTEGGRCFSPDGQWLDPSRGWKSGGSIEPYLIEIDEYNWRVLEWNKLHGNRCAGNTLFGYGNWGWDDYELGDGEIQLILNWSKTL